MPAFRLQDALSSPKVTPAIRAPELTFRTLSEGQVEDEWSFPSDVWSAACTVKSPVLLTESRMTAVWH
jgi:serine/threonine-protein kinase SRPK3